MPSHESGDDRRGTRGRPGSVIHRQYLARRSSVSRGARWFGVLWFTLIYGSVIAGFAFLGATMQPYYLNPRTHAGPTHIYTSDGVLLARLYVEYRVPVRLNDVPRHTIYAVLAAEDARFLRHRGLDWRGILRAAWVDLRTGHLVQGGSTITQQLVRLELLSDRRTLRRKIREVILAVRVERAYTKTEILERYLNAVYFGGGAYGIGAAAERYFGKTVSALTPAESALLAGLIRSPGEGNPRYNLAVARRRQHGVLAMMVKHRWLSVPAYTTAIHEPLVLHPRHPGPRWQSPYVVEAVRQELVARYGQDEVYRGGLTVYTTVNSTMQRAGERALHAAVRAGRGRRVGNGALVAIEPQTGFIRALVGGTDFNSSQFNRALQAHRQPGSAFKTFVYLAALEHGHLLSDRILDAPITVGDWSPHNYGNQYQGTVTLRAALAHSLNSAAVRLTVEVSPYAVARAAAAAGITSRLNPNMTLALGSSEVTPLEMARAFATFANGGKSVDPALIGEVRLGTQVIYRALPIARQRISPILAYLLTQGLEAVITDGTGRRANIGRPAAGKTGTSSDFRDAWFVGYTPTLCAAVWLGNDDRRPMASVAGGSLPAQAWAQFMRAAQRGHPVADFLVPNDLVLARLCPASGKLALPSCPHPVTEYLPVDRVPTTYCDLHYWIPVVLCAVSEKRVNPTCTHGTIQFFPFDQVPMAVCPIDHRKEQTTSPDTPVSPSAPVTPPPTLPHPVVPPPPAADTTPPPPPAAETTPAPPPTETPTRPPATTVTPQPEETPPAIDTPSMDGDGSTTAPTRETAAPGWLTRLLSWVHAFLTGLPHAE